MCQYHAAVGRNTSKLVESSCVHLTALWVFLFDRLAGVTKAKVAILEGDDSATHGDFV